MVCVWEPNLHKEGPDPRRVHFPGVRPELRMLLSQSIADDDIASTALTSSAEKSRQFRCQLKDVRSCQNLYD